MRFLLIRNDDGAEAMIPESALPAEKKLHDVLTQHPGLLPADDLRLRDPVVVGREANLESGYADLVLVDQVGQICLVEVKNEGNPDTRRVIAQLLDYAAALWQLDIIDFHRTVLGPYLDAAGGQSVGIAEYVQSRASSESEVEVQDDGSLLAGLEQSLATGHFCLVVVAPVIPEGVEKVIEYLNAQGHMIYGVEVGFFSGAAECFVPRVVVKPRVSEIRAAAAKAEPMSEADFLNAIPAHAQASVQSLLEGAGAAGASVTWNSYGPALRLVHLPARVIAFAERGRVGIVAKPPKGFPAEPFQTARAEIDLLGLGVSSVDEREHSVRYDSATEPQLTAYLAIATTLLRGLAPSLSFAQLDPALLAHFERNDNIIWIRSVSVLAPYVGKWLRGSLGEKGGDRQPILLEPLKGGQPGWLPRFIESATQKSLWPPNAYSGSYELRVDATA
jgi:hypothetical protein